MTTILLGEYGSRAHGTSTVDSDSDKIGLFVESPEYVTGIRNAETKQSSTSGNKRSTAVDTDVKMYPLRKFASLAAAGNPSVLTAFFLPKYDTLSLSGVKLLNNYDAFISKQAGHRFLGYMQSQRSALLGAKNKRTNRPELVHKYGYDTKFAYHLIRLGLQGIDLMANGEIELPMSDYEISFLIDIRNGKTSKDEVISLSNSLERDLIRRIDGTNLPDESNYDRINAVLHDIYLEEWGEK